jgi:hypothetical protein
VIAQNQNTLVTDATALASIADAKHARPITSLFSTALAQGGRGLVDDDDARRTVETIANGFAGAQAMGAESVLRATTAVDSHLAAPFASRFNRLLQAIWVGSGGRADLFPDSQIELSAGIDEDALQFVLELDPIRDYNFWWRIGRRISLGQIGRLSLRHPNENLQYLVKANLDHLSARSCRVQDRQEQLDELEQPRFWWKTERGVLALRSRAWMAFVAEKADELGTLEGTPTKGVTVPELLERVGDTVMTGLQMSDGTFDLDLSSARHADVAHSDRLGAVTQSFGEAIRVQRARTMAGERQIACDFTKSSASATTSSVVTVSELLGVSLPLLRFLDNEARGVLKETLQPLENPDAPALIPLSSVAAEQLGFDLSGADGEPDEVEREAGDDEPDGTSDA